MKLHLPPQQNFACTSCGRCCRASWTITVDQQAEARIRQSQAYQARVKDGFQPLVVRQERLAIARQESEACTFLDEQNLCELHRELGAHGKPLVCQTYPYLLTQTPDGVFVALSYACPAAMQGSGPSIEEHRTQLEAMIAQGSDEMPQGSPVGDWVEVTTRSGLSWSDYLRLEAELLDCLSLERPVESLLGAAVHLIVAEPAEGDFRYPDQGFGLSRPYNFGGFDLQLASMVASNLLAMTEDVTIPEERAQLGSFFWNGGRHVSARFGFTLPPFSLLTPLSPWGQQVISRYLRAALFGKRLLGGTVVSRLLALVCGVAILQFYSGAFVSQGAEEVEAFDRAFTLVESELLSHTRSFDGFFAEFEEALRSVRDELRAG